jgi:uncharacterized protein
MDTISGIQPRQTQSKKLYSWDTILSFVDKAVIKLIQENYEGVYGVPRGGLIIATSLSYKLNIPLIIDKDRLCGMEKILIVDDIADSGKTLKHYEKYGCDFYTIFYKEKSIIKPKYFSEIKNENEWIVFPWEE